MKEAIESAIKKLTDESRTAEKAGEAMQFAQAVLNLAHTLATLDNIKR